MGNAQGFQNTYTIPVKGTHGPDVTPILRAATHPDEVIEGFANEQITTSWHLFTRGLGMNNSQNRCLGYRRRSAEDGSLAPEYTWFTYKEVADLALKLGTSLLEQKNCVDILQFTDEAYVPAQNLRMLGIFSKNRVEWLVCEQAANAYDIAIVPLYDTLGVDALKLILDQTRMQAVACSLECLPILLTGVEATHHVKTVVLFMDPHEHLSPELQERCRQAGVEVAFFSELTTRPVTTVRPPKPGGYDAINTLCYTSGTA